jgi:Protein of unknown function (DUF3016)
MGRSGALGRFPPSHFLDFSYQPERFCGRVPPRIYFPKKEAIELTMKRLFGSLFLLALSLTTVLAAAPNNVRISFVQPKKFSDFRIQDRDENVSADIFRDRISAYLSPVVAKRFPGCILNLQFTDIDLSGRIIRSNPRKFSDVRIDRNVASPLRLYFNYNLTDARGKTLASGSAGLVDQDYLYRYDYYSSEARTDILFYEKATLYRWLETVTPSGANVTAK